MNKKFINPKNVEVAILKIVNKELKIKNEWGQSQPQKVQMYARDLIGLENKIIQAKKKKVRAKVKKYQAAAQRIFDHIALMGLEEIAIADKSMRKLLRNKLIKLLKEGLKILLVVLLS